MGAGTKLLVIIFLLLRLFGGGRSMIYDSFSKVFGIAGNVVNVRTTRLLSQLCNESQEGDSIERDACYGCFFRASTQPSGYPTLLSMATCADNYLNNTNYGHCRGYLRNATSALDPRVGTAIIYCTFLECIRQVNKDSLVRLCTDEALKMFSNFSFTDTRLAQLFVNTTACILAKTRCAINNPITGAYQRATDPSNKLGLPSINALFVNSYYDINIIQLPFGNGIIDECSKFRNARQADWPTVRCIDPSGF